VQSATDKKFQGMQVGLFTLHDGTPIQTPAMGEDYLKGLISREPGSAFLHTRLGNLMRICGHRQKASEWFAKALALEPSDIEARFHLYRFAVQSNDLPAFVTHARLFIGGYCG
jgi:uncharacterized protein HemY